MRGISRLHPEAQVLANALQNECKKVGITIGFLDTERTKEEQNSISSKNTKAKYPTSMHNWCLAFDICIIKNGKVVWDTSCDTNGDHKKDYFQVGEIGKKLGLFWGGDFKTIKGDYGHFQLNKFGVTSDLIKKYGTPEKFKSAWVKAPVKKEVVPVKQPAAELPRVNISVNGKVISGANDNGTTYAPVRALAEALGKTVSWDAATNTVTIK